MSMDSAAQQEPAPNKKFLILILGGLGILVIIIFIILVTLGNSSKKEEEGQSLQKQASENSFPNTGNQSPNKSPVSTDKQTPVTEKTADGSLIYKNSEFSVVYPPEWKAEQIVLSGGGSGIKIEQPVNPYNSSSTLLAGLNITSGNISASAIEKGITDYVARGFKRDTIKIDNITATKLKGSIPEIINASASATDKAAQVTHIFVSKPGKSYHLEYSYLSPIPNQQLESTFMDMINSFKLTGR